MSSVAYGILWVLARTVAWLCFRFRVEGSVPKQGGVLVAEVGKGHFVYTGLAFFRQLPAGVPGAYRLFANLVSLGK